MNSPNSVVIETQGLSKAYKGVRALEGLVFRYLGPVDDFSVAGFFVIHARISRLANSGETGETGCALWMVPIVGDPRWVYLSPGELKWSIGARPARFHSESDHSRANVEKDIHFSHDPKKTWQVV